MSTLQRKPNIKGKKEANSGEAFRSWVVGGAVNAENAPLSRYAGRPSIMEETESFGAIGAQRFLSFSRAAHEAN